MKKIKLTTIREMQLSILEMMVDIDKLCRKHNIPYFLDGGSALGAKRHQGFIPWDDDFDIGMLRKDYDHFVKILDKELDTNKYLYQNLAKDKHYNVLIPAMKIRKRGTYIKETNTYLANRCLEGKEDSNGLFIDVFIYERMSKNKLIDLPFRLFNDFLALPLVLLDNLHLDFLPLKKLFVNNAKLYGKLNKNSPFIGYDLTWTFRSPFKPYCFRYDDIFPVADMLFEGHKFLVAKNIANFLDVAIGGKWWLYPPKNQQIPKHTKEVIINTTNKKKS